MHNPIRHRRRVGLPPASGPLRSRRRASGPPPVLPPPRPLPRSRHTAVCGVLGFCLSSSFVAFGFVPTYE